MEKNEVELYRKHKRKKYKFITKIKITR